LWIILLCGTPIRVYNFRSDQAISIKALAHLVRRCFSPASEVPVLKTETIGQHIERYIQNIQLAKRELGLGVFTRVQGAIEKTIVWNYQEERGV